MKKYFQPYNSLKRFYEKYRDPDEVKCACEYADDPEITQKCYESMRNQEPENEMRSLFYEAQLLKAETEILDERKGLHYFLDSEELANFVEDCAKETNYTDSMLDALPKQGIIYSLNKEYPCVLFKIMKTNPEQENSDRVVLVAGGINEINGIKGVNLWMTLTIEGENDVEGTSEAIEDRMDQEMSQKEKKLQKKQLRLFMGACLYINCFPEAVSDGFPDFAKHPAHYRKRKCVGITSVPQVIDRSGPIPHHRKGYYRHYKDPRFTNMMGKTQWIEGCNVKGTSKTVTMDI